MVPVVPVMVSLLNDKARKLGLPMPDEDVVLSFSWQAFTVGELAGPLVGSFLAETLGFPTATRAMGLSVLLVMMVTSVILARAPGVREQEVLPLDEPLLLPMHPTSPTWQHGTDMSRTLALNRSLSREFG
mmetsp:Transcript_49988/g.112286  ORF Transcript_49988/g.112286 Transcript_49988/m.112286 type:complete len:130 (+) Transcript_49988:1-390(+)